MPAVVKPDFLATETILPTASARSAGVMAAVCSNHRLGAGASSRDSAGDARGKRSALGSCTLAMLSADCTARLRLSSSKRLVVARAVLPSNATRIEAASFNSATFWWMVLLAKRVREELLDEKITSTSLAVENFLMRSKMNCALSWLSIEPQQLVISN